MPRHHNRKPPKRPATTRSRLSPAGTSGVAGLSRSRIWLFRILAIVLTPVLLLLLLELILRVAGFGYPTSFFLSSKTDRQAVLVQNDRFGWRFFGSELARTPYTICIPKAKATDTIRIFVFGESAAAGDPKEDFGFWRILGVLLNGHYPGTHFEIVNTAMTAIDSHVILPIARESARYNGDIWVIYMGNNEVVGPYGAGTVFGPQAPPLALIRANIAIKSTRTGQWLNQLLKKLTHRNNPNEQWSGMSMFLQNKVRQDDPRMTNVYEHFRSNLNDILEAGRSSGSKIVACTVGSNLKDCAPFASMHRSDLTAAELAKWDIFYQAGLQALQANQPAVAVGYFQQAADIDGTYAELRFQWGQCCVALNQPEEALRQFTLARDADTLRFRADTRINEIIRASAANRESQGVFFVDGERMLKEHSPEGLPGEDLFYEHVHLNFPGNYLLALAVAEEVAKLLPQSVTQQAAVNTTWLSSDDCDRRLGWTAWNTYQTYGEIFRRLSQPPFTLQSNHTSQTNHIQQELDTLLPLVRPPAILQALERNQEAAAAAPQDWIIAKNLSELQEVIGDNTEAAESMRVVTQQLPLNADVWAKYGQTLMLADRNVEAVAAFQKSLLLDGTATSALLGQGQAYYQQGNYVEAQRTLEKAMAFKKQDLSLAHWWLGRSLEKLGQPEQAQQQFRLALEKAPRNAAVLNILGQLCLKKGWYNEAVTNYLDVLKIVPFDAQAHLGLGKCLDQLSRHNDAEQHFLEAVHSNPNLADAHFQLGVALGRKGDDHGALTQFNEAVSLNPGWLEARLNLGTALSSQHRNQEAIEQFQAALRINPNNPIALQRLKSLGVGNPPLMP